MLLRILWAPVGFMPVSIYNCRVAARRYSKRPVRSLVVAVVAAVLLLASLVLALLPAWLPRLGAGLAVATGVAVSCYAYFQVRAMRRFIAARELELIRLMNAKAHQHHQESMKMILAFRNRTNALRQQMELLKAELAKVESSEPDPVAIDEAQQLQIQKLADELAKAHLFQKQLQGCVNSLTAELGEVTQQVKVEQTQFAKASAEIAKLTSANARLSKDNLLLTADVAQISAQLSQAQSSLDEALRTIDEFRPAGKRGVFVESPAPDASATDSGVVSILRRSQAN